MAKKNRKKNQKAEVDGSVPTDAGNETSTAGASKSPTTSVSRPESIAESTGDQASAAKADAQAALESSASGNSSSGFKKASKDSLSLDLKSKRNSSASANADMDETISRVDFASAGSSTPASMNLHGVQDTGRGLAEPSPTAGNSPAALSHFPTGSESVEDYTAVADTPGHDTKRIGFPRSQSGSEYFSDRLVSSPTSNRSRAQSQKDAIDRYKASPGFTSHTKASMAKLQSKVELSSKSSMGAMKDSPANTTQRPGSSSGETNNRREIRTRRSQKDVSRPTSSRGVSYGSAPPTPSSLVSSVVDDDHHEELEQEFEEQDIDSTSLLSPEVGQANQNTLERNLEVEMHEEDTGSSDMGTQQATDNGHYEDAPGTSIPNVETDHHAECERRLRVAEEAVAQTREDNKLLQVKLDEDRSAKAEISAQLESQQTLLSSIEAKRQKSPVAITYEVEALQGRIQDLEQELDRKNTELENKNTHAAMDKDERKESPSHAAKLRQDIEALTKALREGCSNKSDTMPSTAALTDLVRELDADSETSALGSAILQVAQQFEWTALASAPIAARTSQEDRETWEKLYRDERKRRLEVETRELEMKQLAVENCQFERQIKDLNIHLTSINNEKETLAKELEEQETKAQLWESERTNAQTELEKRAIAFDHEVQIHRDEFLAIGAEYRSRIRAGCDRETVGLHRKIQDLQRAVDAADAAFQKANIDNKNLREDVETLHNENFSLQRDIEHLSALVALTGQSLSHSANTNPRVPRAYHPNQVVERADRKKSFEQQRAKARRQEHAEEMLMEKVIAYKMGQWYPYQKKGSGWDKASAQSSWARWEGERWLEAQADEAEREIVEGMRRAGKLR